MDLSSSESFSLPALVAGKNPLMSAATREPGPQSHQQLPPRPPPSTACLPASREAEIPAPSIKVAGGQKPLQNKVHHRKAFLPHGSGFPSARALCRSVCPATSGGALTARCTRAPGRGAGPEGITPGASALLTAGEEDRLPLALTRTARGWDPKAPAAVSP